MDVTTVPGVCEEGVTAIFFKDMTVMPDTASVIPFGSNQDLDRSLTMNAPPCCRAFYKDYADELDWAFCAHDIYTSVAGKRHAGKRGLGWSKPVDADKGAPNVWHRVMG